MSVNKSMQNRAVKQDEVSQQYLRLLRGVGDDSVHSYTHALDTKHLKRIEAQREDVNARHAYDAAALEAKTADDIVGKYARFLLALMPGTAAGVESLRSRKKGFGVPFATEVHDVYSRIESHQAGYLRELQLYLSRAETAERTRVHHEMMLAAAEKAFDLALKTEQGAIIMARAALQNADALPRGRKRQSRPLVAPAAAAAPANTTKTPVSPASDTSDSTAESSKPPMTQLKSNTSESLPPAASTPRSSAADSVPLTVTNGAPKTPTFMTNGSLNARV